MPSFKRLLIVCLALLPFAFSANASAQEEERWYRVELLIFSHEGGADKEQWEPLPALAYPNAARFLVHPQQVEARAETHEGPSELDEFGRQFLYLPPEEDDIASDAVPDIPQQAQSSDLAEATPEPTPELEPAMPATPTPFVALAQRDAEFYGKAAYMQRSGYYKTLFHETWVQPVRDERNALPLIIDRSGDSGDWPRLQGSIKLHLSRYLHLETNLWLNTSGDYLPGSWRMPPPPLGPLSLIVEEPEPEVEEDYFLSEAPAETDLPLVEDPLLETEVEELDTGPVYPWRHAVLMQQKRKMRSKEVHYLDHPLMGVVILITPLDEEELQLMADAEFAANADLPSVSQ